MCLQLQLRGGGFEGADLLPWARLHSGPVAALAVQRNTGELATAGLDGRIFLLPATAGALSLCQSSRYIVFSRSLEAEEGWAKEVCAFLIQPRWAPTACSSAGALLQLCSYCHSVGSLYSVGSRRWILLPDISKNMCPWCAGAAASAAAAAICRLWEKHLLLGACLVVA